MGILGHMLFILSLTVVAVLFIFWVLLMIYLVILYFYIVIKMTIELIRGAKP